LIEARVGASSFPGASPPSFLPDWKEILLIEEKAATLDGEEFPRSSAMSTVQSVNDAAENTFTSVGRK
jgi:hypothetical protein